MTQRRPTVGGNWKMNLNRGQAVALAEAVARHRAATDDKIDVTVFPAFPYLFEVGRALSEGLTTQTGVTGVRLGAQDAYDQPDGAFTGEVSLSMLKGRRGRRAVGGP